MSTPLRELSVDVAGGDELRFDKLVERTIRESGAEWDGTGLGWYRDYYFVATEAQFMSILEKLVSLEVPVVT